MMTATASTPQATARAVFVPLDAGASGAGVVSGVVYGWVEGAFTERALKVPPASPRRMG